MVFNRIFVVVSPVSQCGVPRNITPQVELKIPDHGESVLSVTSAWNDQYTVFNTRLYIHCLLNDKPPKTMPNEEYRTQRALLHQLAITKAML